MRRGSEEGEEVEEEDASRGRDIERVNETVRECVVFLLDVNIGIT